MERVRTIRNQKGQVALFVALIFQVLFVFFAMIVNVGLLVHHKINLQNSVDMAAYYGAMKQAEMLNAIAHINYQIRQSFKLLAFRYRQLGTAGMAAASGDIYPYSAVRDPQGRIIRDNDAPFTNVPNPAFCMAYEPWDIIRGNESYCRNPVNLPIPRIGNPGSPGHAHANPDAAIIEQFTQLAQQRIETFCELSMSSNWFQLAKFIVIYKQDIRNRKKLLMALANQISQPDPRDILNQSIKEGVYKTLYRNLTLPNQESMRSGGIRENGDGSGNDQADFEFYNSFAHGECGATGGPVEITPPRWLTEVFVFPFYRSFDGACHDPGGVRFYATEFNNGPLVNISTNIHPSLHDDARAFGAFAKDYATNDPNELLWRTSLGFEKDPWCVGYVGVSAKTTPKIPFSPLGSVTLQAKAFAKPFGGRIGPWYGSTWPQAERQSQGPQTDALLPTRVAPNVDMTNADRSTLESTHRLYVNHSRYVGDVYGIESERTMAHFAQAIHQRMPNRTIGIAWWNYFFNQDFDQKNNSNNRGDVLAWDQTTNSAPRMRDLELTAVAPDQFDTTYYSIDPDFYNNYLTKIQQGYGNQFQFVMRGDIGSRTGGTPEQERFSIRNQINILTDSNSAIVDTNSALTYYLHKFGQVLTSWQQRSPDAYVLDESRFGQCLDQGGTAIRQDGEERFFTPGSCKGGGRTGYSVKLVDRRLLKSEVVSPQGQTQIVDLPLGGDGIVGRIRNPPPDTF